MAVSSHDFCGCSFALLFALAGGALGASWFGLLGALIGVPSGLVAGWLAGWYFVEANFSLGIWREVRERRRALRPFFGDYWRPERRTDWDAVSTRLRVGDELTGRVVAHFYYGVALDAGLGFPAILTKLRYQAPFSENPPLGAEVAARIDEIKLATREIHLTQGRTFAETMAASRERAS